MELPVKSKRKKRKGKIERTVRIIVTALTISLLFSSFLLIRHYGKTWHNTYKLHASQHGLEPLLNASMDFMYVRGWLQVALLRDRVITNNEKMFIQRQSEKFEQEFLKGIDSLQQHSPKLAEDLTKRFESIRWQQDIAESQTALARDQRDSEFLQTWFNEASSFVSYITSQLSLKVLDQANNGSAFILGRLMLLATDYRNYFGSEWAIVTSMAARGGNIEDFEKDLIIQLNALQNATWQTMQNYTRATKNPATVESLKIVEKHCYGDYRDYFNSAKSLLFKGMSESISVDELSLSSLQALDSLQTFIETVYNEYIEYIRHEYKTASSGLVFAILIFVWAMVSIVISTLLLRDLVFQPLALVLRRLTEASGEEENPEHGLPENYDEMAVLVKAAEKLIRVNLAEQILNERIQKLADTDTLTNLLNRRAFMREVGEICKGLSEAEKGYAIAILDLDHFKKVNDKYGHAAGDETLRRFATVLKASLRHSDRCSRHGGEEFACFLPGANADLARLVCERIRLAVERMIVVYKETSIPITVSIGVCVVPVNSPTGLEEALQLADRALYEAKDAGRNTVILKECDNA